MEIGKIEQKAVQWCEQGGAGGKYHSYGEIEHYSGAEGGHVACVNREEN